MKTRVLGLFEGHRFHFWIEMYNVKELKYEEFEFCMNKNISGERINTIITWLLEYFNFSIIGVDSQAHKWIVHTWICESCTPSTYSVIEIVQGSNTLYLFCTVPQGGMPGPSQLFGGIFLIWLVIDFLDHIQVWCRLSWARPSAELEVVHEVYH